MDVYFAPLACSLATRIALDEAQLPATFHEVDPLTRRTLADGADYRAVHPLGLVPTLRTDGGELLTENAAVLQYVADRAPGAGLAPTRLGLTWRDHVSFQLSDTLQLRRVQFVGLGEDGGDDVPAEERFDIDFALMTGELSKLLDELTEVLGGVAE